MGAVVENEGDVNDSMELKPFVKTKGVTIWRIVSKAMETGDPWRRLQKGHRNAGRIRWPVVAV